MQTGERHERCVACGGGGSRGENEPVGESHGAASIWHSPTVSAHELKYVDALQSLSTGSPAGLLYREKFTWSTPVHLDSPNV